MGAWLVFLTGVYAWATVAFGFRFSNLTDRGIITNGPYAWTKHPAYVSKNLFWWFAVLPFFAVTGSVVDMIPQHRDPRLGQRRLLLARADRGEASLGRSRLCRLCRMDGPQRPDHAAPSSPDPAPRPTRRSGGRRVANLPVVATPVLS